MQQVCAEQEPPLESKAAGDLAACHFPLTEQEAAERTGRDVAAA
jgi:peptide/nickel transport system ATP-binding protein/oligopeptide transport system ATP-binding protein